jgi:hypothetical protein
MANHKLSLEVPTVMNPCIISIMDTSVYADLVPVTCPTLNVTVPGFTYSVQIDFTPNSNEILTACDLELQVEGCAQQFLNLPDGVYIIKYSVSPNDSVYVEYNHLRITQALNKYNEAMCDLDITDCAPTCETENQLKNLRKIRQYLDAAVAKVETCHEPQKGMTLYNYALKLIDKLGSCGC